MTLTEPGHPPLPPKPLTALTRSQLMASARDLRLKKRFDQHFLIDDLILSKIVAAVDPKLPAIEVGPGCGFLTQALLASNIQPLQAIELERAMIQYLKTEFSPQLANGTLALHEGDVLSYDFQTITPGVFQLVGNLPYSVATPLVFKLVGELNTAAPPLGERLQQCVIMVQKEVGDRMAAQPGSKAYGPLSLACQRAYTVETITLAPPRAFSPPPRVDSIVLKLSLNPPEQWRYPSNPAKFARLVKTGFQHRRKTFLNALQHGGYTPQERTELEARLATMSLPATPRAEAIALDQFIALSAE
ncbi:MAG: 16S rRNA (adenine(1518)-N(6)/adenine(1519)-N(6))-dimethyltransferase RsmA [Vampirovibrionales bacterium]|nr:16S rRNA (adenine(1518)-N(6)/adenine(1519)-N(6))-dimethyltransferase RsmA [Vampirovibrionales bacterium]